MSKSVLITDESIVSKIYHIRGFKVMLDSDLAEMYGAETKRLNEQVKRNIERFPKHFMFQLTQDEVNILKLQFATSSLPISKEEEESLRSQIATLKQGQHSKYLPYAFTEHGGLMLSNVLKSERAIKMSIKIIDVFVKLREMLLTHKDILLKLEQLEKQVTKNNGEIQIIFKALKQLLREPPKPRTPVGFKIGKK